VLDARNAVFASPHERTLAPHANAVALFENSRAPHDGSVAWNQRFVDAPSRSVARSLGIVGRLGRSVGW